MQETASTLPENPRSRVHHWLPFGAAIASTLVLIVPVLANPNAQLFYRDTSRLYYPVKQFISERINAGHLPLWDPWTEAGVSLLGQISPGVFHPFTLLYLLLPFELAFKLNHLLALPMAAAGAYWFARKLGSSPWAAAAAGIIFGGAGYIVSTSASNLPYALGPAGMPAACAALLELCERPSIKRLLLASVLLALCNYSGEPQSALFAGVIGGACALAVSQSGLGLGARERLRRAGSALLMTAVWGAAALALSMPAVLPGGLRAHDSQRWGGISEGEKALFAVHPVRLAALLIPVAFDDTVLAVDGYTDSPYREYFSIAERASFADSICLGVPAMLLALLAFFTDRRGRWLALGGLVCALAAAGQGLGVMEWVVRFVPGLGLFRYAEKMLAPASLLFALAAARGFDVAFAGTRRAAVALAGISATAAALILGSYFWIVGHAPQSFDFLVTHGQRHIRAAALTMLVFLEEGLLTAGVLAIALSLVAVFRAASPRRLAPLVLGCACCFAAMMSYASDLLFVAPVKLLRAVPPLAEEMIRRAGPSENRWRFFDDDSFLPDHPMTLATDPRAHGTERMIRSLSGQYDSLLHVEGASSYFSLLDDSYLWAFHEAVRNFGVLFDVRFVYSGLLSSKKEAAKSGFKPFDGGWLRENPSRPRAFLVAHVYNPPAEGPLAVLADATFDPATAAVVDPKDHKLIGKVNDSLAAGDAAYQRLSPEQIDVEVSAPSPRLLVVAEHFDAGWSARLDGAPVPVVRVDGAALGVPVSTGQHQVQLRFWPRGLTAGFIIAGGTLAAFAAALFFTRHKAVRGQDPALD